MTIQTGTASEECVPPKPTRLATAADVLLLLVYGAVAFFFVMRWVRLRKAPSLLLALSVPLGWLLVALWDLGIMPPISWAPVRWIGVGVGLALLTSVVRWDNRAPEQR